MIQKAHKSRVQNNILFQIQSLIIKGKKKVLIPPETCSTQVAPSDFYTVETKLMLLRVNGAPKQQDQGSLN